MEDVFEDKWVEQDTNRDVKFLDVSTGLNRNRSGRGLVLSDWRQTSMSPPDSSRNGRQDHLTV